MTRKSRPAPRHRHVAFCYRSGTIHVGKTVPDGALPIGEGSETTLRRVIRSVSRHGYEKGVYLVPGVPEAESDSEAVAALTRFLDWASRGNPCINAPPRAAQGAEL